MTRNFHCPFGHYSEYEFLPKPPFVVPILECKTCYRKFAVGLHDTDKKVVYLTTTLHSDVELRDKLIRIQNYVTLDKD